MNERNMMNEMKKELTDRKRITIAFRELRKAGYFCRRSWSCCRSCGITEIPKKNQKKFLFYCSQSNSLFDGAYLGSQGLWWTWYGNGHEIARAFEHAGFKVEWDGTEENTIRILGTKNLKETGLLLR